MNNISSFLGPVIVLSFPFFLWLCVKHPDILHLFILKPMVIVVWIACGAFFIYAIATASWSELFSCLCSFLSAW